MINWFKRFLAVSTLTALAACGGGDDDPAPAPQRNIVQVAQSDAQYSVLVEALTAADLSATLAGPGPYTVFAPTNAAFTALLGELGMTKEQLLADKPLLTSVLTYHVLSAKVPKAAVPLGKTIRPLQGGAFKIDTVGTGLVITDGRNRTSNVITADIAASNGVIHSIDKVLLPPNQTLVEAAAANPDFSILVEAVTAADLAGTLSGDGPFTVFAPTNAAFAALLEELQLTKAELLADKATLTEVLKYHVVGAQVLKAEVPVATPINTLAGQTLTIDAGFKITDQAGRKAGIVATDVLAKNGVIHVIDKVILPAP